MSSILDEMRHEAKFQATGTGTHNLKFSQIIDGWADHVERLEKRPEIERAIKRLELLDRQQPLPSNTIRVRIAVAMQSDGQVSACGIYGRMTDAGAKGVVEESIEFGDMIASAIIEADIPLVPVVRGKAVEAKHV